MPNKREMHFYAEPSAEALIEPSACCPSSLSSQKDWSLVSMAFRQGMIKIHPLCLSRRLGLE